MYDEVIEKIKKIESGFKETERESSLIVSNNTVDDCFNIAKELYLSEFYQVRSLY